MPQINITIAVPKIPWFLDLKQANGQMYPVGIAGRMIGNSFRTLLRTVSFFYALPESGQFGKSKNGTYDGIIGLLQRGEASVSILSYVMDVPPEIIDYTHVVHTIDGYTVQRLKPSVSAYQVSSCYTTFPCNIWLLVFVMSLLSLCTLTFYMKMQHARVHLGRSLSQVILEYIGFYLDQFYTVQLQPLRAIELSYMVCVTLILVVFENAMHSEMVVKNESHFVNNLDDLVRLEHERPGAFEEGVIMGDLKAGSDKMLKILWERMKKMGLRDSLYKIDPGDLDRTQHLPRFPVFIGSKYLCKITAKIDCSYNRKNLLWMSRKRFTSKPCAFYYSKFVPKETKRWFNIRVLRIAQSGLNEKIWEMSAEKFPPDSENLRCLKEHKEELYENIVQRSFIAVENVANLLIGFLLALLAAAAIFLLEMVKYIRNR